MIAGVGTDILSLRRFSNLYNGSNLESFLSRVYTEAEIKQAKKRPNTMHYFASRFAGKEAIFKSLCISNSYIRLSEIEIINDDSGIPTAKLYGNICDLAQKKNITDIKVSLSYDDDYFIAYAISISENNLEDL